MSRTITDATVFNAFKKASEKSIDAMVKKEIEKAVDGVRIYTGKLTKCYQHLNKVEVSVNGKTVVCKVLQRCGGNIVDLFTPLGFGDFDENMGEPYIEPLSPLDCLVVDINSGDNEWLMLGYFTTGNMIITTPASAGDYKIARVDALEEQEFSMKTEPTYSKSEVDKMFEEFKKELLEELKDDTTS